MARLAILGLLHQRPMHGYEIQQYIQDTSMELWANVLSGSIYFALNKMEEEGLVRGEAEERTGNRLRKIYAITEAGREALLVLVQEALASPPHTLKSDFPLALGLAHLLPRAQRREILERNLARLAEMRRRWEAGQAGKAGISPFIEALLANDLALIDADLGFLRRLLEINEAEAGGGYEPAQATHLIVRTRGSWRGNPYMYEEVVPIKKYEASQWWQRFSSKRVLEVLDRIRGARAGETFTINDGRGRTITEIVAIVHPER